MTDDIDIYRAAKLYIDNHGDQAALQAAMQADALLEAGDIDGAATRLKPIVREERLLGHGLKLDHRDPHLIVRNIAEELEIGAGVIGALERPQGLDAAVGAGQAHDVDRRRFAIVGAVAAVLIGREKGDRRQPKFLLRNLFR